MMETAQDIELEKINKEKEAHRKIWEETLDETANWFNEKVFINEENQWPLVADKRYHYELTDSAASSYIEKGNTYDSVLARPRGEGSGLPLKDVYRKLQEFVQRNNLNVPSLHR